MKTYSLFVLRYQPFNDDHIQTICESLNQTDETIIAVSSGCMTVENSETFEERKSFILSSFSEEQLEKIRVYSVEDMLDSKDAWIASIENLINNVVQSGDVITLAGTNFNLR